VTRLLFVCLGGAAGSGARYLVGVGLARWLGTSFPWGTLTVNVLGSLLLGTVMELGLRQDAIPPDVRLFLAAGVMGGFTTYSSFNYELLGHLQRGAFAQGGFYLAATVSGCLVAGLLGAAAVRLVGG
jgi:fluoride exporter